MFSAAAALCDAGARKGFWWFGPLKQDYQIPDSCSYFPRSWTWHAWWLMQDHNIQNISRADWQHFSCKYFREWDSSTTLPVENRIMHLCHLCHLCQQKTSSSIHWYPLKIVLVVKKFQAPRLEIHYIPLRIRWLRVFSVHVSANEMIVGQSCGLITGTSRRGSGRCSTQLILHRRSQLVPCHRANACGPWKFIWS